MKRVSWEKGFTLIELLLVVVIIGLMLSVIVPRAWRANIDAKYGLVRQNCSELASFGQEWVENQLLAQNETVSTATADDYLTSLTFTGAANATSSYTSTQAAWIADTGSNWSVSGAGGTAATRNTTAGDFVIPGRFMSTGTTTAVVPETTVEGILPPEKVIRNPFNEVSVFTAPNDPSAATQIVTGAIACTTIEELNAGGQSAADDWHYYSFLFQGTDSITSGINLATSFYAGQSPLTLAGQRNGIFFARVRP